jgi:hypothetical protein
VVELAADNAFNIAIEKAKRQMIRRRIRTTVKWGLLALATLGLVAWGIADGTPEEDSSGIPRNTDLHALSSLEHLFRNIR